MEKELVIQRIKQDGVVAVIRAETADKAIRIVDACLEGGVRSIELTFTVPQAHQVLAQLRQRYNDDTALIGAGTVLDPETARIAILEGANYIVSPALSEDTMRLCNRYRVACMPGCMTIREVISALELGADIIKVFPGEVMGPSFVKSVLGPLPQARLMPTGGVSPENVGDWIAAGVVAVGAGSQLTAGAKKGDYAAVTAAAKAFMTALVKARG